MVTIARDVLEKIREHARRVHPEECCGVLLGIPAANGHTRVIEQMASENRAASGERRFRYEMDPLVTLRAQRRAMEWGLEIVGFYHSHPDHPAVPSATDAAASWDTYLYLILSVNGSAALQSAQEWRLWQFIAGRPEEIAGTVEG